MYVLCMVVKLLHQRVVRGVQVEQEGQPVHATTQQQVPERKTVQFRLFSHTLMFHMKVKLTTSTEGAHILPPASNLPHFLSPHSSLPHPPTHPSACPVSLLPSLLPSHFFALTQSELHCITHQL